MKPSREAQMAHARAAMENALRPHSEGEQTAAQRVLDLHEEQQRRQASLLLEQKDRKG